MPLFIDREDAGRQLGELLRPAGVGDCPLVLGIPDGGGIVAGALARFCRWPVDIVAVRALGLPGRPAVAIGAVASGGIRSLNRAVIQAYGITKTAVTKIIEQGLFDLDRLEVVTRRTRETAAGGGFKAAGRTVILVDDGSASKPVWRAAIQAARKMHAGKIIAAVPVTVPWMWGEARRRVERVVSVSTAVSDSAAWEWYEEFQRVDAAAVVRALRVTQKSLQRVSRRQVRRE